MADTSDVEAAIVQLLGAAFYPNGINQSSTVNAPVNVERGWPTEVDIRKCVQSGTVMVRVLAVKGFGKDMTRFPRDFADYQAGPPALIATLVGNIVTFTGTTASNQIVSIKSDGVSYNYLVVASDTLSSVAAALAAEIPGASSSGAILTLSSVGPIPEAVVVEYGTTISEVQRELHEFQVTVWAPSFQLRDLCFATIRPTLAYYYRLALSDNTAATLMDLQGSGPNDFPSRAGEWRRDIRVAYDFATTYNQLVPAVASGAVPVSGGF